MNEVLNKRNGKIVERKKSPKPLTKELFVHTFGTQLEIGHIFITMIAMNSASAFVTGSSHGRV